MKLTKENKNIAFRIWETNNSHIFGEWFRMIGSLTAIRAAFYAGIICGEANAKVPQSAEPIFTFGDV